MQSDVFKYVVTTIKENLANEKDLNCEIVDCFTEGKQNQVKLEVIDLFQCANDRTGQKIVVKEKLIDIPTQYVMILRLSFSSKTLEENLSTYGQVAVYFKDHSSFDCGEYGWHGNNGRFYIEPVVRTEIRNCEYLHLDYRIDLQLNSVKDESFKRVEQKNLIANQIK